MPLGLVAVINLVIDPYLYFYSPSFKKINQFKPEREKHLMLSKAAEIKHIETKIIFLGSSRVMSGLNTKYPGLKYPDFTYNLGLPGVNMYQIMHYFNHALANQSQIEQVILGIDFFMFNENLENLENFDEARLEDKIVVKDIINNLLSIDALKASVTTFKANLNNEDRSDSKETTKSRFKRWLTNFLTYEGFYGKYNLSQARLENLQAIVDKCKQHNIELIVFISPTHATQYEAISVSGLWQTFEQWKREVIKITPVWDFSGYNSITTESISDRMDNYIDNSHYSLRVGDLVLSRMLSFQTDKVPEDFGILVTSENIESHLNQVRLDREIWQKEHPEEVNLVKTIKAKTNN
ncbi:MAG: hypothetical protein AB4368_07810 [Xenococcaceae cyanobacterium]